jgi:hypothetical protein
MSIKPPHYTQYEIEPIDYIESKNYNFSEGNIVKYITRYKKKDGLKDLQKAEYYCKRLIEKQNQKITTQDFCEKNKLDQKVVKIIKLVDIAHIANNTKYLQDALLIIQDLKKDC